jgi:hypothetical protein
VESSLDTSFSFAVVRPPFLLFQIKQIVMGCMVPTKKMTMRVTDVNISHKDGIAMEDVRLILFHMQNAE